MSIVVEVRFPPERLPQPEEWQRSIAAHGFAAEIETSFDPREHSGFLPGRYRGHAAGFEYYFDVESDTQACVSLEWSGSALEAISGIIASACLAQLTNGVLEDAEAGESIHPDHAIAWARNEESGFEQMIEAEIAAPRDGVPLPASQPWWKFW